LPNASERLSDVLELVSQAPSGLSASEVAESLSLSRAASYRLLNLMVESSLLEKDSSSQLYTVALRLWSITSTALRRIPLMEASLLPMADGVRTSGLGIILGVNRGAETFFLRRVERLHDYVLATTTGHKAPIHVTATGKAILAFEPMEIQKSILAQDLRPVTARSLSGKDLLADLKAVHERGYALNFGEGQADARGIAVPVFDARRRPIAGVGSTVPMDGSEKDVLPTLRDVSHSISRSMGYVSDGGIHLP
jgi:DNA-binding IclR family transcriptional regulator